MSGTATAGGHVFLSCGEASGDHHGAALIAALRERNPDLRFSALGGPALQAAGAELVQSAAEIAVMGFGEVLTALPALWRARRRIWRHLAGQDIDLCLPIDFPGFNLRLARHARGLGIPVFYLIPPQLWAWGEWRLGDLRRSVDQVGTILPFEAEYFGKRGVPVVPLGHPLMDEYASCPFARQRSEREQRLHDPKIPLTLGILPGSRHQEIKRMLPLLQVAAQMFQAWLAPRQVVVVVSVAPGMSMASMIARVSGGIRVSDQPLPRLLEGLDLALVCSGTASLEAALAGVPHEVVYVTSELNYQIARRLLKISRIGLANLILQDDLVREHIQREATPLALARSLINWVNLPQARTEFYDRARRLRKQCGEAGVWERAAEAVCDILARGREGAACPSSG